MLFVVPALVAGCASAPERHTLADLKDMPADVADVRVEDGLDKAILGYGTFLEETPDSPLTPEAMRRLADLKVEKEYGIIGDGALVELPAPENAGPGSERSGNAEAMPSGFGQGSAGGAPESDAAFEARASAPQALPEAEGASGAPLPDGLSAGEGAGPREAIALYDEILERYPYYEHNDLVLYQKARAYDELGEPDAAMAVMDRLVAEFPSSRHADEAQFRRAEYFFVRKQFLDAEYAYQAVVGMGEGSEYYELALYKLGWALYKQELHEEAADQYVALLDYKLATGYDFDAAGDEHEERRVADTYRVISLSFSNLGGPEAVGEFFSTRGSRSYEDRVYSQLGEFYFEKLRYHDAANTYNAFIELYPLHRTSPRFGMRIVEIYDAGGFPRLVLESKKDFANRYGRDSDYWRHFAMEDAPEVLSYLKGNLEDLASHYHALYQEETLAEERPANYAEALNWYDQYLATFPADPETPGVNYRLADLRLENGDFSLAALEYERTAYEYAPHEQAAAAGYAAIFAHREHQKAAGANEAEARREAVRSTLQFVDTFPGHEHADVVLGAAVDDLYDMQDYETAIVRGRQLIEAYPDAEPELVRAAWAVVANASLDTARFVDAEQAYARLLELTPADDEARQGVVDNLAAAIYKQGEESALLGDDRAAADHYLRIGFAAPGSAIRPAAEYDAAAALMRLEDWGGAAAVLESFRQSFPEHDLNAEATKQIAFVYREDGQLARSADEYARVADEATDPELRSGALLEAGELYEQAGAMQRAIDVYLAYVEEFPRPVEMAVEIRHKLAGMYRERADGPSYRDQLEAIVAIDADAGEARTARMQYLAATSALVLAEHTYEMFVDIELVQPFDESLAEKQRRMDELLASLNGLLDYEVADVTAAATYYIGETYYEFSRALIDSERPSDLSAAEMQDYEMVIEEEAFPFEELSIEVHEKNLELLVDGVFNPWVERSLAKLADLMPGRYAKLEISPGFLNSIDTYAYLAPESDAAAGPAGSPADAAPAVEAQVDPDGTPAQPGSVQADPAAGDAGPETDAPAEPALVEPESPEGAPESVSGAGVSGDVN
jgi:outer membrane protein assembly factor BamD (BamD/ComL family)